jgi:hypothetical protein
MRRFPAKDFRPPALTGDWERDHARIQSYLALQDKWNEEVEWLLSGKMLGTNLDAAAALDHGSQLTGLADDDHTQYAGVSQVESISGVWTHTAELKMIGAAFTDEIPVALASAAELTVPSTSNYYNVTGGGTITLLGPVTAGRRVLFRFNASTVVNHDATTLALIAAANTTYAAGTHALFVCHDGTNWREVFNSSGVVAHNLLSATHGDTLAGTVVRGDIIIANSTPKWARLAKGTSGQVVRSDGADPLWATLAHADLGSVTSDQHHAQLHKAAHVTGGGDAFASTDVLEAIAKRLQETAGPTTLAMGAVADGEGLKRSGSSVVGFAIATAGAFNKGFIHGLRLTWLGVTQVRLEIGQARDSSDAGNIDVTATKTLDITTGGANGLDTGAEAASTWYAVWAIGKTDGTTAGLLSVSFSAPTMPTGYTLKRLVGAVRNDASSNLIEFWTAGNGPEKDFYTTAQGQQGGTRTTASTTWATRTMGGDDVPAGQASHAWLRVVIPAAVSSAGILLRPTGSANNAGWFVVIGDSPEKQQAIVLVALNSSGQYDFRDNTSGANHYSGLGAFEQAYGFRMEI